MTVVPAAEDTAENGTTAAPARPPTLRERVRADPTIVVVPVAALLIIGQLVLRGWAEAGGYYLLDDLVFIDRASNLPFDGRIFDDYNGHLMPGSFALVQVLTAIAPLSWPAVVAANLVQQLAIDVVLFRLLVLLFGRRPAVLIPLAVYVTSSITLPAFLWWAAALNQLPMQLAVLLALRAWVRYLRSGQTKDAVRSVLAVAGGLLFSEKSIIAVPLLVAVTLCWFVAGPPLARVLGTARKQRTGWLLHAGLAVVYLAFYFFSVESPIKGTPTPADTGELAGSAVLHSVLPGLLGGPWQWEDFPPTLAITDPPEALAWLSVAVSAVVIAVSLLRRRGAGRAWVLLALYVAGTCVLLGASRVQIVGPYALAREYRYFTDVAMIGALCVAFAFLPVRDAPEVLRARSSPRVPRLPRITPVVRPVLGTALVLVLAVGSVVSTLGYTQRWHANQTRPFLENATADLAERPGTVLVNGIVPDPVQWHVLGPYALASSVLAADGDAHFLHDGDSTPAISMLDDQGHVQGAHVVAVTTAVPGTTPNCGWLVADRPVPVPLQFRGVGPWDWVMRVVWLSAADNTGWVTAGEQRRIPVSLPAGLHEMFVQVSGAVDTVTIELADPTRPVCVANVEIGSAQPLPPGFR
jgi:hypothetical protein